MIDFVPFLKILPVFIPALISPGPSFVMISNLALNKGRAKGIECAAGLGVGDAIYAALSILGLGFLFKQIPELMIVLKILGGLYLIYIGVLMWRFSFQKNSAPKTSKSAPPIKQKNPFIRGVLTGLTNPKTMVFYGSIFTLALENQPSVSTQTMLPVLCGFTAFVWYGFVAATLSVPKIRKRYQHWSKVIDRSAGTILILFGLKLVLSWIS